jgi:hypothetical protein
VFHHKLLELESELVAKEQAKAKFSRIAPECEGLLEFVERQVEVKLAAKVPKDWKGWLTYRRAEKQALVVIRGAAFKDGVFGATKAGADVPFGLDTVTEYQRGFDVSPPQDLDHLLVNFGHDGKQFRIFMWYGENIAPYKLVFAADVEDDPHHELSEAIVEACTWVLKRPKHLTLERYLKSVEEGQT